jgi:hypothetical protein
LQQTKPDRSEPSVWFGFDEKSPGLDQFGLLWFGTITANQALSRSLSARVRPILLTQALSRCIGARINVYSRSDVILCVLRLS